MYFKIKIHAQHIYYQFIKAYLQNKQKIFPYFAKGIDCNRSTLYNAYILPHKLLSKPNCKRVVATGISILQSKTVIPDNGFHKCKAKTGGACLSACVETVKES